MELGVQSQAGATPRGNLDLETPGDISDSSSSTSRGAFVASLPLAAVPEGIKSPRIYLFPSCVKKVTPTLPLLSGGLLKAANHHAKGVKRG